MIIGVFKARRNDISASLYQHYLILTNSNLVYWDRGLSGDKITRYEYDQITNLEIIGVFIKSIYFKYNGIEQKFADFDRNQITTILMEIRNQISNNSIQKSDSKRITDEDPVSIVKIRYAKGEISETEMNKMISTLNKRDNKPNSICKSCNYPNEIGWKYCASCGSTNHDIEVANSNKISKKHDSGF